MKTKILFILLLTITTFIQTMYGENFKIKYPETPKIAVNDTLHSVEIIDNYQWLENGKDPKVIEWENEQEKFSRSIIDNIPQRKFLVKRLNYLWRYDDEGIPDKVLNGERIFFSVKKKDKEKWIYCTKENENASAEILIDPNEWDGTETLAGAVPSRDGKYIAIGKAKGGNEEPVIKIMEVETKKFLPDTLRGRKQYVQSWLPDNSGFYYSANPLKGEVPEGEEYYWQSIYFHKLGTPSSEDKKVFYDDKVKEHFHNVSVSEDGKYLIFYKGKFYKNEVYFKKLDSTEDIIPIATGFDAQYSVDFIEDKMLIHTDSSAPMYKVYITDIDKPQREYWKEFIPENKKDKLLYIAGISGHIYAIYEHNAYTLIKIYNLDGNFIRDLSLPTLGTAYISGYWSKPDIWVSFSSFTYPTTTFKYNVDNDSLKTYKKFPLDINVDNYTTEQVWYKSKDGTPVSMFLIHRKDLEKNGNNPTLLYGYGGFNISMNPYFSTVYVVWLEAGGMIALPNLRGGGEYGEDWHKAGMKEKKQNVFDDFIYAGEWLIKNKYTNPKKLAISGESNGGLLVGAVVVQRPDLFKVADCGVPLLDMVRYHKFGLANIWKEEYGSADDLEQFKYLYKYSPYHNVVDGTKYPAILITTGENDARVDPMHARKMVARMQSANPDGEPILLLVRRDSGHGGGTTLSIQIEQFADEWAFLMYKLGMKTP